MEPVTGSYLASILNMHNNNYIEAYLIYRKIFDTVVSNGSYYPLLTARFNRSTCSERDIEQIVKILKSWDKQQLFQITIQDDDVLQVEWKE